MAFWTDYLNRLGPEPKIGLCWRSGLHRNRRRNRFYPDCVDLVAALPQTGCTLINLQYGECDDELELIQTRLGRSVVNPPDLDQVNELDRVAALMSALDLVIAPSTAVSQLACSLGVPVVGLGNRTSGQRTSGTHCSLACTQCSERKSRLIWRSPFSGQPRRSVFSRNRSVADQARNITTGAAPAANPER